VRTLSTIFPGPRDSFSARPSAHLRACLCLAIAAVALGGCKKRGKQGDSDAPDESGDSASNEGYGRSDSPDPGSRAGEGNPEDGGGPGRNRNARDLKYLTVDGERCVRLNKREHQVDVNQDGYADLVTLYATDASGTEVIACKQADLNFDGRLDAFIHYTPTGEVSREQYDTDFDGRIDMGRYYEGGKLVRDELDLNQDGFADSWRIYDGGRLVRVETDRDADGRPDMFTYYVGKQIDRIGYDVNGDGKVDTWDHDAARRARLAIQKRQGSEPAKTDESAYVEEEADPNGKAAGKAEGKAEGKADGKAAKTPQKPKAKPAEGK
jgi:hypothetical protein